MASRTSRKKNKGRERKAKKAEAERAEIAKNPQSRNLLERLLHVIMGMSQLICLWIILFPGL